MTLPTFIVVGAAKSGTTSLWYHLDRHPDIFMSPIKETKFFARDLARPEPETRTLADYRALFGPGAGHAARGEVSNIYLNHAAAVAPRIHAAIPECRVVVIVRDPVERLYSRYWHAVRDQYLREPFATYAARARDGELLADRITVYRDLFGAGRLCVLFTEQMERDWDAFAARLYAFLGVAPIAAVDQRMNQGGRTRWRWFNDWVVQGPAWVRAPAKLLPVRYRMLLRTALQRANTATKPDMDKDLRAELAAFYHDDMTRIGALAGAGAAPPISRAA